MTTKSSQKNMKIISKETINRLVKDVKHIIKNPLTDNNIFYSHDEDDVLKGYALIIGPSDTPYFGGYYFFELNYPENTKGLQNRTIKMIRYIIKEYHATELNILLVTHQGLCDTILKIINKFSSSHKNQLNTEIEASYQKGKLCLIFDNDWTFKKLN